MEDQLPLDQLPENIAIQIQEATGEDSTQTPITVIQNNDSKSRRSRHKWTAEETQDLIKGCGIHGVGNWKK